MKPDLVCRAVIGNSISPTATRPMDSVSPAFANRSMWVRDFVLAATISYWALLFASRVPDRLNRPNIIARDSRSFITLSPEEVQERRRTERLRYWPVGHPLEEAPPQKNVGLKSICRALLQVRSCR